MNPFIWLIFTIIDLYFYIIIAMVVMSWLTAFNIINTNSDFVRQIQIVLYRLTEPVLGPIRRFLPSMGGIDLSPMVLLIGLMFIKQGIGYYILPMMM